MTKTKTRAATIFMDENDILHIVPHEGVHVDYEDILDIYLVIKRVTKNKPVLKLIESARNWSLDKKARNFIASKDIKEKTIARAIIKNSLINTVLLSFFLKLNRSKVPTKAFTKYDDAYKWLLSFKE